MRRIAIHAALSAVVLLANTADAQTLYKCVASNVTSYQQVPCSRTARLVRTMETTPEPAPTATQLAEQARKTRMDREESAFLSHLAGTDQAASSYRVARTRSAYRSPGVARRQHDDTSPDRCKTAQEGFACKQARANRVMKRVECSSPVSGSCCAR